MLYPADLRPATFLSRLNRFSAAVDVGGRQAIAHVANSGRLVELFQPGNPVWLADRSGPLRKTPYDLLLVQTASALVSADARLPPLLVKEAFVEDRLPGFEGYSTCRSEVAFEDSRLDLAFEGEAGRCLVEVKSITLIEGGRSRFPDSPTLRGARHLRTLMEAKRRGMRAAAVFVVQRPDAEPFSPHDAVDPAFGAALRTAHAAGVEVLAFACDVTPQAITLARPLPVVL